MQPQATSPTDAPPPGWGEFDADTAVALITSGADGADGATITGGPTSPDGARFRAQLTPRWNIGDKPNGGYVLAVIVRAVQQALGTATGGAHPDPLTVTGHYLRPSQPGPAEIRVDIARVGRQLATASATFTQGGRERVRALATFGDLGAMAARNAPEDVTLTPPDLPPVDQCHGRPPTGDPDLPALHQRLVNRLHPDTGWLTGQPSGRAEVRGWLDFIDGRPPDVLSLPLFADAMPPAVFEVVDEPGWVPTVELTVHVRGRPAPGLLRTRFRTRNLRHGLLEEDGEIWDSEGRLVAQSRQLGMLLLP